MSAVHWAGHLLWILFGPSTWGSGGNMVAWVICGAIGGLWVRARLRAHHLTQVALANRHHAELKAQATAHQNELKQLTERRHNEAMDRIDAHQEALKAHLTATLRLPAKRPAASKEGT